MIPSAVRQLARRSLLTLRHTTSQHPQSLRPFAVTQQSTQRIPRKMASTSSTSSSSKHTNGLIHATSPYLLQHAHNPVDWQIWSRQTLERAKRQDKMIFLSSGYSACHWCHVMAHESFEDEEIAALLNENFVCVKLDREERPDVDAAYMTFIQATSGRGGWPMSVFLTSDAEPLFGGTYFSPPMFTELIERLAGLWTSDRQRCLASARDISQQLRQVANAGVTGTNWQDLPDVSISAKALKHWLTSYDDEHGGFGSAPKFPSPSNTFHFLHRIVGELVVKQQPVNTLLEAGLSRASAEKSLQASAFTLARIARGGIADHLAGGVARYSVDEEWRVPHFEKMLYDQGQLLVAFAEVIQLCRASSSIELQAFVPEFIQAIQGIVSYLDRYMRDTSNGSIFAAEDADSLPEASSTHAKEGAFYVWDYTEVEELLGKGSKLHTLFVKHFALKLDGNIPAHSDPHGELVGKNMLHASVSLNESASGLGIAAQEAEALLDEGKQILLQRREQRPRPMRDDKIVTAWNALAISGLAKAYTVLGQDNTVGSRALTMAKEAAEFLRTTMWNAEKHEFVRSYRNGVHGPAGVDVDYAYTVQAFLDLYAATFDGAYIDQALRIQASQDALFWDNDGPGGYFISSASSDGNVLGRQRGDQEGAEPTSTSVSAHNLLRLSALVSDLDSRLTNITLNEEQRGNASDNASSSSAALMTIKDRIAQSINSGGQILTRAPFAICMRVTALLHARLGAVQIVVMGKREASETQALLNVVQKDLFLPRASVIFIDTTDGLQGAQRTLGDALANGNNAVRQLLQDEKLLQRNASFATVCQDFTCGLPIRDANVLKAQLLA